MRRQMVALACLLALVMACTPKRAAGGKALEQADTYVVVNNLQTEPFTIYATDGSRRVRLGSAPPLRKTRMLIPRTMIFPAVRLQFLAQPQGNAPAPVSEPLAVSAGDEIGISIGP